MSNSCGTRRSNYVLMDHFIKLRRPKFIIECGTGISTYVLAQSMLRHLGDPESGFKLISMEHQEEWYEHQIERFPEELKEFVEIVHSPIDYYQHMFINGTVYSNIPDYPYDFVFIDGPSSQGMCNMDFIRLIASSEKPMSCLIDGRVTTSLAYSILFGKSKVTLFPFWGASMILDVTKDDLRTTTKQTLRSLRDEFVNVSYRSALDLELREE
tara:strand:+ start:343 stop:978 length:636 start_codon:yes stop_codon:yes gene_type:complete